MLVVCWSLLFSVEASKYYYSEFGVIRSNWKPKKYVEISSVTNTSTAKKITKENRIEIVGSSTNRRASVESTIPAFLRTQGSDTTILALGLVQEGENPWKY